MTHLGPAEKIVAGAIGEPGNRAFYLQIRVGVDRWFLIEKGQVAALSLRSNELLSEIGFASAGAEELVGLDAPEDVEFRIGEMSLAYSEESGMVTLHLIPVDEDREAIGVDVTPAQLDVMATAAIEIVASGRPLCPRCGLAVDPDGHPCPSDNGNLRGHRP